MHGIETTRAELLGREQLAGAKRHLDLDPLATIAASSPGATGRTTAHVEHRGIEDGQALARQHDAVGPDVAMASAQACALSLASAGRITRMPGMARRPARCSIG